MRNCKVLVWDLDGRTGLAETLKKMLAAEGSVEFQDLVPESPPPQSEDASAQLSDPPNLTFVLSSANSPSKIMSCLELLRARRMECPVVGVIDAIDGRKMLALLHAGLSDFRSRRCVRRRCGKCSADGPKSSDPQMFPFSK